MRPIALGALILFSGVIAAATARTVQLSKPRHLPVPSCYIGHLQSMQTRQTPEGVMASHFSGYMEDKVLVENNFAITIPAWPDEEPHVLMCIRIAPGDSADLALR